MRLAKMRIAQSLVLSVVLAMVEYVEAYRINFGSCNDVNQTQPLWKRILEREPDLWVWGGDNIYADFRPRGLSGLYDLIVNNREEFFKNLPKPPFTATTKETLEYLYDKQRNEEGYSSLVERLTYDNIIGIWDDHDYGLNDAGKSFQLKETSQESFLDFFNVDKDSVRRERKGIYYYSDRDQGRVRFIMLDNRYHKDEYTEKNGDFLGQEQWTWLEDTLRSSTADLNVIVSGLQIFPDVVINNAIECWNLHPVSRQRLLDTIIKSTAKGVILVSGDVHFSEMMAAKCTCAASEYFVPEVTSSGLTHAWGNASPPVSYFLFLLLNIIPNVWRIDNLMYMGRNFGELNLQLEEESPSVETFIFDEYGKAQLEKKWELGQLKQAQQTNCTCEGYKGTRRSAFECYTCLFLVISFYLTPYIVLYYLSKYILFGKRK